MYTTQAMLNHTTFKLAIFYMRNPNRRADRPLTTPTSVIGTSQGLHNSSHNNTAQEDKTMQNTATDRIQASRTQPESYPHATTHGLPVNTEAISPLLLDEPEKPEITGNTPEISDASLTTGLQIAFPTGQTLDTMAQQALTVDEILNVYPSYEIWLNDHNNKSISSSEIRTRISGRCHGLLTLMSRKMKDMTVRNTIVRNTDSVDANLLQNHAEWLEFFNSVEEKIKWAKNHMAWLQLVEAEYEQIRPYWEDFFLHVEKKEASVKEREETGIRVAGETTEIDQALEQITRVIREFAKKTTFLASKIHADANKLAEFFQEPEWIHWSSQIIGNENAGGEPDLAPEA